MLPVIAIVGRPNVGKSTLFNRLTRTRAALVADMPGLTRDRQYGRGVLGERDYIVVDTGGMLDRAATDSVLAKMSAQAWLAVAEADAVLFLVDARDGVHPDDALIAKQLRRKNKSVFLAVNKVDGLQVDNVVADFYQLGFKELFPIAAEHGSGVVELITAALVSLPVVGETVMTEAAALETDAELDKTIKIAFVGRPNVGKSTLINRILGEERVIVYDQPGTTRDSIFINFERRGRNYILIDTAGVRRRGKTKEAVEKFSVIKTLRSIEEANVAVLLIDAQENITDQDLWLLGFILESGKALVIAVNKWDNLPSDQRIKIRSELDRRLTFVNFAKIYFISALHGTGVGSLFGGINSAYFAAMRELTTPLLTRVLEDALTAHQIPMVSGKRIRLRYAHPGGHNPPVIVIHGNRATRTPVSYRKYLEGTFRRVLDLWGTPVKVIFKNSEKATRNQRSGKLDEPKG